MPTVTIHHGNWIMLPERVLKALGFTTGDRLQVELAGGDIVLRVVGRAGSQVPSCQARSSRSIRGKTPVHFPKSQHPKCHGGSSSARTAEEGIEERTCGG